MFNEKAITRIKEFLTRRQETIAVAESVTSGFLQAAFSSAEEAMKFYQGGITAYNIGQKARHLNIDPIHALSCNCVSEKMAEDMATSICLSFTCHWGIAVTGYASPIPESGNKQFAYYAICKGSEVQQSQKISFENGSPMQAQLFYVNHILDEFVKILKRTA